jgi:CheY-like chemotaxis protein
MGTIIESAEHHYLTMLDNIRRNPKGWVALYFSFSKKLDHKTLVEKPAAIKDTIAKSRKEATAFLDELNKGAEGLSEKYVYMFADHDIVMLAHHKNDKESQLSQKIFSDLAGRLRADFCDYGILENEIYNYQKLADHKLLTCKRYEGYEAMSDTNRLKSISVRRKRRDHPMVMVVEDDRFTASYAANILNKDFDLLLCRSGEEAVAAYAEHAPDIVLLDIHLPGLSGHETLQCIRAMDAEACVWMLSVDTAKSNVEQASTIGADGFLKKPFSKERLLNTVKSSPYVRVHLSGSPGESQLH